MAHQPEPRADELPDGPPLYAVAPAMATSAWQQPRDADGAYVSIGRRALPSLTSMRFVAAIYVVVHHLVNMGLLWAEGGDADRSATLLRAWSTQGHVGVTFFFVLSGFILAWCYHETFATIGGDRVGATTRRFWRARFARVWPLHAAMFMVVLPITLVSIAGVRDAVTAAWQGLLNLLLLQAWVPTGTRDGLAQTFNGPSWTLSCEALFYAMFPLLAVVLLRRLRWGVAQLAIAALATWALLGAVGAIVGSSDTAIWTLHVFPPLRAVDFVVGVLLGLAVVQGMQRRVIVGEAASPPSASRRWTVMEAAMLLAMAAWPLAWVTVGHEALPETLGSSWFYLPVIATTIGVLALERGALSRRVLAWSPLVWLGEVSYALYLVHMPMLVVVYRAGVYDRLGLWPTSVLFVVLSILVAGIVHERFEKPMRSRLVGRRAARSTAQ